MKMKTLICLNNKGNEIIALCLSTCRIVFFLSNHHRCMGYYHQCSLHHICISKVSNDQGLEVIFNGKDICSLSDVTREKVGNFLFNICSIIQSNSCDNILKYIGASMKMNVFKKIMFDVRPTICVSFTNKEKTQKGGLLL